MAVISSQKRFNTSRGSLARVGVGYKFTIVRVAMAEGLCRLAHTTKVLRSNLGVTRHRMTSDKSLTAVCFGSTG
jgi:hypothetical protein